MFTFCKNYVVVGIIASVSFIYIALPSTTVATTISLDAFTEFTGEMEQDLAGTSVSTAGDVNGDGYDDFLVGAPEDDTAAPNAGAAYLIYGTGTPLTSASLSTAVKFTGEATWHFAGASVSSAGDVNGDGYDDILVGAHVGDDGDYGVGTVYLIYGSHTKLTSASLSTAVKFTEEESASSDVGSRVSSAGDVNGDGYDDILIGAFGDREIDSTAGAAYLIYGSSIPLSSSCLSDIAIKFTGEAEDNRAGDAVSAAGDVNGDGYDDFLVGAPWHDVSTAGNGAVYLIYGSSSKFTSTSLNTAVKFTGVMTWEYAGTSVSSAGDVNGDGYDDILIGADVSIEDSDNTNIAYLIYGAHSNLVSASLNTAVKFTKETVDIGYSVSTAGDVNNDGYDDILIGTSDDGIYVIYGSSTKLSLDSLSTAIQFIGETMYDIGYFVSSAGDVNGDGYDDVLIGDGGNNTAGLYAGAAYLGYVYIDNDHDGITGSAGLFSGSDCNDNDAAVSSNQTYYQDSDGDGLGSDTTTSICSATAPTGYVANSDDNNDIDYDNDSVATGSDCNDADDAISSNQTYYQDNDNDGLGSNITTSVCLNTAPTGYVTNSNDSNDEIKNNGVEINNDRIDNDGDGVVDEINTLNNNGAHPYYSTANPADGLVYNTAITRIKGLKYGYITVSFADQSIYKYKIFNNNSDRRTLVQQHQASGYLLVLHPNGKFLALVNPYNGDVISSVKLSHKKYKKSSLKQQNIRQDQDSTIDATVISKIGKTVRLVLIQVDITAGLLNKKDSIMLKKKPVNVFKTNVSSKKVQLRSSSKRTLMSYPVNKQYKFKK